MARFYGTVKGNRGTASRLGHTTGGLRVLARSWNGSIETLLYDREGEDWATVLLIAGDGHPTTLFRGPLREYRGPFNRQEITITQEPNDGCYSSE